MRSIAVINPKGGCGKTTLATNLAGYYAAERYTTVLLDYDSQGSSSFWNSLRSGSLSPIHTIPAFKTPTGATRSWHMRMPAGTERVIIDTPAGLDGFQRTEILRSADVVLIPVLPSPIDIHAVSDFIKGLDLDRRSASRPMPRMAIIANRLRGESEGSKVVEEALGGMGIPVVARLRESQNYLKAAEAGMGIHDARTRWNHKDREQWIPLLAWLEQGFDSDERPATARRFL